MNVTLTLVKGGAGISLLPLSMIYEDLKGGRLQQVLPTWSGIPRSIYCVWPVQRSLSIRANRFAESLRDYLKKQPWFTTA